MRLRAVAFDLGGTLVRYYDREEFPCILAQALDNVYALISDQASHSMEEARCSAMTENRERSDGRVCPVHERLMRIFGIRSSLRESLPVDLAQAFLEPIFACGQKYEDVDPVLSDLRKRGYRLAIASNTPWGTPAEPWRRELERHGLILSVDAVRFCMDVGWRKPAPPLFRAVLDALSVRAKEAVFVGDHPLWDYDGAQAVGMLPVLIDREDRYMAHPGPRICSLDRLPRLLDNLWQDQRVGYQ
jgi:FMN phosphatase YigB (HAD superfamily)